MSGFSLLVIDFVVHFSVILHLEGRIQGFDWPIQEFIAPIQGLERANQGFSYHILKFTFFTQF